MECTSNHCTTNDQSYFSEPNLLSKQPSCALNMESSKNQLTSIIEDIRNSTLHIPQNITNTAKRTKAKPTKRKSSMSDIQPKRNIAQNNLLRNRSKSTNISNNGQNFNNHDVLGVGVQNDINATVLTKLLSERKIIPNISVNDGSLSQVSHIQDSGMNKAGGTYTFISPVTLNTTMTGNTMHVKQLGTAGTSRSTQKRNIKVLYIIVPFFGKGGIYFIFIVPCYIKKR